MQIQPVVLSGGYGSRLWPASRQSLPKQFLNLVGSNCLFFDSLERAKLIHNSSPPIVVASRQHNFLCQKEAAKLNLSPKYILEERGCNTAAAVFFAALFAQPKSHLLIMPSDHWFQNNDDFTNVIMQGVRVSEKGVWVTFGIHPTNPSTSYGYVEVDEDFKGVFDVKNFVEKPDHQKAKEYLAKGNYFWNSGIFMVSVEKCLESFYTHQQSFCESATECWERRQFRGNEVILKEVDLEKVTTISVDYAIMEKEKDINLIPFKGGWSDLGTWTSISSIASPSYASKEKQPVLIDTENVFVHKSDRTIACVGIKDLIIVDSDDATLILHRDKEHRSKEVLTKLKVNNNPSATKHTFELRPWGMFEVLVDNSTCKVKRITVSAQQRLSLQYHQKRAEHWVVVEGTATVRLGEKTMTIVTGGAVEIPLGALHSLANDTDQKLVVIETQTGSYFGEDDIVRVEDPYDR
jgi:mannose-1-phosphate guanylyltransferase/mannose-6-phosphate isomerase